MSSSEGFFKGTFKKASVQGSFMASRRVPYGFRVQGPRYLRGIDSGLKAVARAIEVNTIGTWILRAWLKFEDLA